MRHSAYVDCFDSTLHLTGRKRTYDAVKAAALVAGRFSVFEATNSARDARLFTQLEHDPEVETFRNPPGFPWIGIRRALLAPAPDAPAE